MTAPNSLGFPGFLGMIASVAMPVVPSTSLIRLASMCRRQAIGDAPKSRTSESSRNTERTWPSLNCLRPRPGDTCLGVARAVGCSDALMPHPYLGESAVNIHKPMLTSRAKQFKWFRVDSEIWVRAAAPPGVVSTTVGRHRRLSRAAAGMLSFRRTAANRPLPSTPWPTTRRRRW